MTKKGFKRVPAEAKIIGANLRYLREASGLSQQEVARILNVCFQQVQKYERGINRFPVEKLYVLRHYYNIPYEIFFQGLASGAPDLASAAGPEFAIHKKLLALKDSGLKYKIERIVAVLTGE